MATDSMDSKSFELTLRLLKALLPLLVLVLLVGYALHWMLARPVGQVSIYGEVRYVDQQQLQERALPWLADPFWRVDLTGLSRELEQDPWLEKVTITRRWPDQIDIQLIERTAWAHWNEEGVLDEQGEAFFPPNWDALQLPLHLYSEPENLNNLLSFYQYLNKAFQTIDLELAEIQLEARGAWRVELTDGVTLLLGRDNIEKRINRFIWTWQQWSSEEQAQVKKIDTRYPNGLTVGWQ